MPGPCRRCRLRKESLNSRGRLSSFWVLQSRKGVGVLLIARDGQKISESENWLVNSFMVLKRRETMVCLICKSLFIRAMKLACGLPSIANEDFPLSLADDARQWWINKGEGKITTWEELIEKFFYKFYPKSYDGEEEMLDEGNNWGIDPLEFIS
ncbi:hypothetical protein Tco_0759763 [Tanacetum coccineum]